MNGLIPALTGRGFVASFSRTGVVMTSPDPSAPVSVVVVPSDTNTNEEVTIFLEGRKMATFYRQPDHTILTLVDHLVSEGAKREDDQ